MSAPDLKVMFGGSWCNTQTGLHSGFFNWNYVNVKCLNLSFRLVIRVTNE